MRAPRPSTNPIELSVVTPMHDEELCVEEFVRRTDLVLDVLGRESEIVIVSDGSTDRTNELLTRLSARHSRLRCVFLSRCVGQCSALEAGLQHSRGRVVVVMDGDLQHLPEEIPLLVAEMDKGFDLVSGSRAGRQESWVLRRLPSLVANALMRRVSGCDIRDMGGFKCIRGDIARSLRLRPGQHRLLPALVHLRGGSTSEVFVSAPPRLAGRSHYGLSRAVDVIFDILMLWFQSSFKSRPLYLFGRVAAILLVGDALIMSVLLYDKIALGIDMGTRPPFLIAIMFFLSALFVLAAGFILELLSDTLQTVSGVTPYVVSEVVADGERRRARDGIDAAREPAGRIES